MTKKTTIEIWTMDGFEIKWQQDSKGTNSYSVSSADDTHIAEFWDLFSARMCVRKQRNLAKLDEIQKLTDGLDLEDSAVSKKLTSVIEFLKK